MSRHNKILQLAAILTFSLFAAQFANAALIFTFSDDGAGGTSITVSDNGDGVTTTAGGSGGAK